MARFYFFLVLTAIALTFVGVMVSTAFARISPVRAEQIVRNGNFDGNCGRGLKWDCIEDLNYAEPACLERYATGWRCRGTYAETNLAGALFRSNRRYCSWEGFVTDGGNVGTNIDYCRP